MKNKEIKQSAIDALALQIFEEFKAEKDAVTFEEAQEMAKMELKAKDIKRYEKSETPRKKVERERKVDPDKKFLMQNLDDALCDIADNVEERKNESEIHFTYNESSYTLKLIKHRPQK